MALAQVNAMQLMASFLGSEKEKISQGIVQSDFTGELKKLMPPAANCAQCGTTASSADAGTGTMKGNAAGPGPEVSGTGAPGPTHGTDSSLCSAGGQQKCAGNPKAKIKEIEAKANEQKRLFVTNPAIAETVLADLQYPAETIKACKNAQNKDGLISIKDLKSLLTSQPASDPGNGAQVPAEHARALVESIIAGDSGTNQKGPASGGEFKPSVQVKPEGSYSPDELRGLLENVLQEAHSRLRQAAGPGSEPGSQGTAQTSKPAQTIETAQAPKVGQTEMLAATVLPSFILEGYESGSIEKVLAANAINPKVETQSPKVTDASGNSSEPVSNDSKPDRLPGADKIPPEQAGSQAAPTGTGSRIEGEKIASSSGPDFAPSPARQESTSVKDLYAVLKYFDATLASADPQQQLETTVDSAPAPGGLHESLAAQAQSLAFQVKGAEKQADKPGEALSSGISQEIAEQSGTGRIRTVSAEFPSNQTPSDDTENQSGDSTRQTETPTPSVKLDSEALHAQFGEALREKPVETPVGNKDSVAQSMVFQNSASAPHSEQISPPKPDNLVRSGFDYYDAYQSAELGQDMGERLSGTASSQLVLDIDPDGLGKISIKVGAKKDEITVAALTQSEPAREALMRNASELRQDLQDQGLVLEKFTVDVNSGRSGNGNYAGANNGGGKITPPPKETGVLNVQTPAPSVNNTNMTRRSQISIFA